MRKVRRNALVPYSAEQMYRLVDDIVAYPEFLPWCAAAEVHERDGNSVDATLVMRKSGISRKVRTRNTNTPGEAIELNLAEGPFVALSGRWIFEQLGMRGSKVSLEMDFEFDNRMADAIFGRFFEQSCDSLVDAFVVRAADVYSGDQ